jgi:hypothetical protein
MATNVQGKASASDFTGATRERQAKENADLLTKRAEEISTINAAEKAAHANEIIDVTKTPEKPVIISDVEDLTVEPKAQEIVIAAPVVVDEVTVVASNDDGVVIRVNEDLQQVTVGDKVYDFIAGRKYKVPKNVAFVLDERGRLWH